MNHYPCADSVQFPTKASPPVWFNSKCTCRHAKANSKGWVCKIPLDNHSALLILYNSGALVQHSGHALVHCTCGTCTLLHYTSCTSACATFPRVTTRQIWQWKQTNEQHKMMQIESRTCSCKSLEQHKHDSVYYINNAISMKLCARSAPSNR